MKTTKIYVGNLPDGCTTDELKGVFEQYGRVAECDIVKNYAFVHMSSDEEAQQAISALHETEIRRAKISVEASHSKVRQKPGMGGKGQCYRCGKSGHWSKDCPRNIRARRDIRLDIRDDRDPRDYGDNRDRRDFHASYRNQNNYQDVGYSKRGTLSSSNDSFGPMRRTTNISSSNSRDWTRPYPEPFQRVATNNYITNSGSNISTTHHQSSFAPYVLAQTSSLQPNYNLNQTMMPIHQAPQTVEMVQQQSYIQPQRLATSSQPHPTNQLTSEHHQPSLYQTHLQPTVPTQLPVQTHSTSTVLNNQYIQPQVMSPQNSVNYYYRRPQTNDSIQYNRPQTNDLIQYNRPQINNLSQYNGPQPSDMKYDTYNVPMASNIYRQPPTG